MVEHHLSPSEIGWIDGWSMERSGLALRVLVPEGRRWVHTLASPDLLLTSRVFEPSCRPLSTRTTGNIPFDIADICRLASLIDPGEVAGELVPTARKTSHSIFVIETAEGRIYVPAMLLIRELWLWSDRACDALLTPNGVDVHVGSLREGAGVIACSASTALVTNQPSDTALRRVSWLAQCPDAHSSWGSVLTRAHQGVLGLTLPHARLTGWAWGIHLKAGLLACELSSIDLQFGLPHPDARVRVGRTSYACPAHGQGVRSSASLQTRTSGAISRSV